jgi:hypothetical protein
MQHGGPYAANKPRNHIVSTSNHDAYLHPPYPIKLISTEDSQSLQPPLPQQQVSKIENAFGTILTVEMKKGQNQ